MHPLVMKEVSKCHSCGTEMPTGSNQIRCNRCLVTEQLLLARLQIPAPSSAENAATSIEESGSLFGDYILFEEIARGGMGRVHRARQKSLNRIVALKRPLPGVEPDEIRTRRFRTEAEAVAALAHPNIIPVFECGEHDGEPYFSMAYIEGETLAEVVRRKGILPLDAARYVVKIARAIHHAHQRGVLHRDLKPANILLDHSHEPRVADFGIACLLSQNDEAIGAGTPHFMAPEQIQPGAVQASVATDVYALGGVLYHLLTGRSPAEGQTREEVLWSAYYDEPVAPRERNAAVPLDLESICLKALQKDPILRYGSAEALAEDLDRFLHRRPVQARPVSMPARAWMWVRRNPILASLLLLLVGSLMAFWVSQWLAAGKLRTARAASEGFIGFMNRDLAHDLRDLGRLDLMEKINGQAAGYYTNHSALGDPGYWDRKAQFFENSALVAKDMGELANADARAIQAESIYEDQAQQAPNDASWKRNLSRVRTLRMRIAKDSGARPLADAHGNAAAAAAIEALRLRANDPISQANLANVLLEQASLWIAHHRMAPAEESVDRAEAILSALVRNPDADPEWSLWRANCSYYRGLISQLHGDPAGSLSYFTNYLSQIQLLVAQHPQNVRWQFELTVAYSHVGDAQRQLGQTASAQHYFQLFETSAHDLTQLDSRNVAWLALYGESLAWQGYLTRTIRPKDPLAGDYLRTAWLIQSNLVFRNPDWDRWLETAGRTCSELAKWHQAQGETRSALGLSRQWRNDCKARAIHLPEHAGHQQRWGRAIVSDAVLLGRIEGRPAQLVALKEALTEFETNSPVRVVSLARARVLVGLAEALQATKNFVGAAAILQEALDLRVALHATGAQLPGLSDQILNNFCYATEYHLSANNPEMALRAAESGIDWATQNTFPDSSRLDIAQTCQHLIRLGGDRASPHFVRVQGVISKALNEILSDDESTTEEERAQTGVLRGWLNQRP